MTIEFHCPHCEKLLRTDDDKAGVQANCPGCGQLVAVPLLPSSPGAIPPVVETASGVPAAMPSMEASQACPMCGGLNAATEFRCRVCGESLGRETDVGQMPDKPAPIDIGRVLEATWRLFQARFGLCTLSGLLVMIGYGILMAIGIAGYVALMLAMGVAQQENPAVDPGSPAMAGLLFLGFGTFMLVYLLATVYMTLGQLNLMMKIAKGEPAEIADMFRVGKFFWRGTIAALIYAVLTMFGSCLLIFPGLFVMFMLAQSPLIIMDQDVGAVESLKRSYRLTKGNLVTIFVLGMILFGVSFAFNMVCNFLNLFTISFGMLAAAVVYRMQMGRPVARS